MTKFILKLFVKNQDYQNPKVRQKCGILSGIVGIICNTFLCIFKITLGLLSGSLSVTADGLNNLSDAGSSSINMIGFKIAGKPADKEHPFGHQRVEYISGMIISFLIILLGFQLLTSSVKKIFSPAEIEISVIIYVILGISILLKFWMFGFYRKIASAITSQSIKAQATDSLNDMVSTSAVLICTIIADFSEYNIDAYVSAIIGLYIIISGIKSLKDTLSPLLGEKPPQEFVNYVCNKLQCYDGVLGIHDLVVHNYGPNKLFVSVHAEVDRNIDIMESHEKIDNIERDFAKEHIELIIHLDPVVLNNELVDSLKATLLIVIKDIHESLQFHDFRLIDGPNIKNIIFDLVIPVDFKLDGNELEQIISRKFKEIDENYLCVINFDYNYMA